MEDKAICNGNIEPKSDEVKVGKRQGDRSGKKTDGTAGKGGMIWLEVERGKEVKGKMNEDKIIEICMKIFWPTLVIWCIAALAKIILVFS